MSRRPGMTVAVMATAINAVLLAFVLLASGASMFTVVVWPLNVALLSCSWFLAGKTATR